MPDKKNKTKQKNLLAFYHQRGQTIVVVSIVMLDDVAEIVLVVLMYSGALFFKG